MAEPARRSAAGPRAPGWGDVRRQMMVAAQAVAAALAAYLAAGGDDASGPAVMSTMALGVLTDLGGMARRLDVGEAVIEAERARAVAEDRAACPRPRGGHLRAVT
jgi:hypothetical protein